MARVTVVLVSSTSAIVSAVSASVARMASTTDSSCSVSPRCASADFAVSLNRPKGPLEPVAVDGGLAHAQPALAPEDPGDLLDQVLLGRPLRRVLGHQCGEELPVLLRVLPRQDGVA